MTSSATAPTILPPASCWPMPASSAAAPGVGGGAALRGAALGVQAASGGGRPLLSLPVPRAAARGRGADLQRGRRAGRGHRRDGHVAGDRGAEGDPRRRGEPVGQAADLGRAGDAVPHGAAARRPRLRAVRRRRRPSRTCRCIGTRRRPSVPSEPLGILLLSGAHDRAHYAFVLASGAAALGRDVVVFATNTGCHGAVQRLVRA